MFCGATMIRRYLIVNGVSTAALYGALIAAAPVAFSAVASVRQTIELLAIENSWLGPIVHRVVTVTSGG
jgi:hypothetical protein